MEKDFGKLFEPGKPAFYLTDLDESSFADLRFSLIIKHPKTVVKVIRGGKSTTVKSFFSEVAAALQFPYYFGENWNAFNDCINDLEWLPGEAYIILISNASVLLADEDFEDFRILIKLLRTANREWLTPNKYFPRNRRSTPFRVIFQCTSAEVEMFSKRLIQAEVEVEAL